MDLKTRRERRLYQGPVASAYSTFSPDGTLVAFGQSGARLPVFTVPVAGGDAKPAGNAEGRVRGWSNDGRYLLISRVAQGANGLSTVALLELASARLVETLRGEEHLSNPRFSADNRWVAFQSGEGLRATVWVAPYRDANSVPKTEWTRIGAGVMPFWSPDSRTLYFARYVEGASDANLVMRQPLNASGGPAGPSTDFFRFESTMNLSVVNTPVATKSYLYTLQRVGISEIWLMDLP
jgi:Tol biopolymer transport system component